MIKLLTLAFFVIQNKEILDNSHAKYVGVTDKNLTWTLFTPDTTLKAGDTLWVKNDIFYKKKP
jgi:hypothetical protein